MEGITWTRIGLIVQIVGIILAGVEVWGQQRADSAERRFADVLKKAANRTWIDRLAGSVVAVPLAIAGLILSLIFVSPTGSIGQGWLQEVTRFSLHGILKIVPPLAFAWFVIIVVFWTTSGAIVALVFSLMVRKERSPWKAVKRVASMGGRRTWLRRMFYSLILASVAPFNLYLSIIDWTATALRAFAFLVVWLLFRALIRLDRLVHRANIPRTVPVIGFLCIIAGFVCQIVGTF